MKIVEALGTLHPYKIYYNILDLIDDLIKLNIISNKKGDKVKLKKIKIKKFVFKYYEFGGKRLLKIKNKHNNKRYYVDEHTCTIPEKVMGKIANYKISSIEDIE